MCDKYTIKFEKSLPFNHTGRFSAKYASIMNPGTNITLPQLIAEIVIWCRRRVMKDYKNVSLGKGWSNQIQGIVRNLVQQGVVICSYFPHPDDDSLVLPAIKAYMNRTKPLAIGGHRRVREKNGKLTITSAERDVVLGICCEYNRLKSTMAKVMPKQDVESPKEQKIVRFDIHRKSNAFDKLLQIDKLVKKG